MKHTLKITLILVLVFFLSQLAGLAITNKYVATKTVDEATGEVNITYSDLPLEMERPQVSESVSYIYILSAILIGTALVLLIVKFRGYRLWKFWFFFSVLVCLTISFAAFVNQYIAIAAAAVLAILKIYRPNFIIHNLTEIFIYGGLAAIFVPIMNVFAAILLLLLISIYDMIAVWQSKHMVKMAKFQTESKVFAGLLIPYKISSKNSAPASLPQKATNPKPAKTEEAKNAILGGGDIGFPLLFAGVVMKSAGFLNVLIIPISTTVALFLLLYFAKKDRFYPAMPFLSLGCFIGYGLMLLFGQLL